MYANSIQSFRKGKREKVVVFENCQEAQIENDAQPKPKFSLSFFSAFFYLDSREITQKS
jgi:hypothetical protein